MDWSKCIPKYSSVFFFYSFSSSPYLFSQCSYHSSGHLPNAGANAPPLRNAFLTPKDDSGANSFRLCDCPSPLTAYCGKTGHTPSWEQSGSSSSGYLEASSKFVNFTELVSCRLTGCGDHTWHTDRGTQWELNGTDSYRKQEEARMGEESSWSQCWTLPWDLS